MKKNSNVFIMAVIMVNVLAVCMFGFVINAQTSGTKMFYDQEYSTELVKFLEPITVHTSELTVDADVNIGAARIKNKSITNTQKSLLAVSETNPMKEMPMSHWQGILPAEARHKALNYIKPGHHNVKGARFRKENENKESKIQGASNLTLNNR